MHANLACPQAASLVVLVGGAYTLAAYTCQRIYFTPVGECL